MWYGVMVHLRSVSRIYKFGNHAVNNRVEFNYNIEKTNPAEWFDITESGTLLMGVAGRATGH